MVSPKSEMNLYRLSVGGVIGSIVQIIYYDILEHKSHTHLLSGNISSLPLLLRGNRKISPGISGSFRWAAGGSFHHVLHGRHWAVSGY